MLVLFSDFLRLKVTVNENVSLTDYALDYSKLNINQKKDYDATICWYDVIAKFFWRLFVSIFHVNIITDSEVMKIFFYKRLIRNLEIGNAILSVWHNIWGLGWVRDAMFRTNGSNEILLKPAKAQDFTSSELL